MKKIKTILAAFLLLAGANTMAQTETESFKLFQKENSFGGFGGFSFNAYNGSKLYMSGEGAGLFNNFYIGGYGYGTDIGSFASAVDGLSYDVRHSSGGIMLGAFSNTKEIFALYGEVKLGYDHFSAETELTDNTFKEFGTSTYAIYPSLGFAFRPTSFFQLRLYGGYTFSGDVELNGIDAPFNAPIAGIGLTFGSF